MICPYCFSNDVYYRHEVVITIDVDVSALAVEPANIAGVVSQLLEEPDDIADYAKIVKVTGVCYNCDGEWRL